VLVARKPSVSKCVRFAALPKSDNECRIYLLETLGNFARNDVPDLCKTVPLVLSFASSQYEPVVQTRAVEALRWLIKYSNECAAATKNSTAGVGKLFEVASSHNELGRCHAVLALAELCTHDHSVRELVIDRDNLELPVRMLNTSSTVQRHAAVSMLAAMLDMGTGSDLDVTISATQATVVSLLEVYNVPLILTEILKLRTESELTILGALHVMKCTAFYSGKCQQMFTDVGAVPLLLKMMQQHEDDLHVQCNAALCQLLRYPRAREDAERHGAVLYLCNWIHAGLAELETEGQVQAGVEEALLALFFIAETREFRQPIGSLLLEDIGRILRVPYAEHPVVVDTCAGVLRNIVCLCTVLVHVHTDGFIGTLCSFVQLFRCYDNKRRFVAIPRAVECVAVMLKRSNTLGQQHATGVVMALFMECEFHSVLMKEGILELVEGIARAPPSTRAFAQSLAGLWNFCLEQPPNRNTVRVSSCGFVSEVS
jgi:hypothetical protein